MNDPRVTGAMRYAQDVEFEGMLHARILRSPYPHAHVLRVDTSAVPDHIVVLTQDDIRELGKYGCQIKDQTVLAVDRARFAGDPVAAVAAPTRREAEEALSLIDVEYEELPGVYDAVAATLASAPLIHEQHPISDNDAAYFGMRPQQGTNICHRFRIRHGNIQEGFDKAEVIVEETYRTAGAQHAHMEPHASVAFWKGDRLEIWTGTQTPFNLRMDLAGIFGIPEAQIRIVCPPMGGAFGAKTFVRYEAIVACLARKAGRPLQPGSHATPALDGRRSRADTFSLCVSATARPTGYGTAPGTALTNARNGCKQKAHQGGSCQARIRANNRRLATGHRTACRDHRLHLSWP